MDKYRHWHQTSFKVRDYECDLQGRVNNSVYGNYFEHSRHEFLLFKGIDFAELCEQKIHLVVRHLEIDYLKSLSSRDEFTVFTKVEPQGRLKVLFHQHLLSNLPADEHDLKEQNNPSRILYAKTIVTGVAVNEKGKPFIPDVFQKMI
jgi:acyl-CoA thioester hydrolase